MPRGSNQNQYVNFELPDTIGYNATYCLQLSVPATDYYVQQLFGHLQQLTYWFNYDRDADKRGRLVAGIWRKIIEQAELRETCAAIVQRVPELYLPAGMRLDTCGLFIDERELAGDVFILTDGYQPAGDDCDTPALPGNLNQLGAGTMSDGATAVDINNLQQQIDALQSELDGLATLANDAMSAANLAFDKASTNETAITDHRQDLIGSVRWFPVTVPQPAADSGWVYMNGQTINRLPTVSGDSIVLYDRVPDAWKDTQNETITLPAKAGFTPLGFSLDPAGTDGDYLSDNTGGERIAYVTGTWYIYIGDAQVT